MNILKLLFVAIFSCTFFYSGTAQKDEDAVSKTYLVNDKSEFNNVKTIVIFLNGEGKQLQNVLQDALTTKLKVYNWDVIDREQLESEVTKDYQTKQKKAIKDSSDIIVPLSIEQMTDLLKAQHYMIIDYTVGQKRYSYPISKSGTETTDKIVISNLSFRILKVGNKVPVAIGAFDFLVGRGINYVAEDIKQLIGQMK